MNDRSIATERKRKKESRQEEKRQKESQRKKGNERPKAIKSTERKKRKKE